MALLDGSIRAPAKAAGAAQKDPMRLGGGLAW